MLSLEITILTLNVWGIPYISKDRYLRMHAISEELSSGKYDIVSLQEVWSEKDYSIITNKTKEVLPYNHYFYSGVIGAGLCVLSKFPITAALFHAWSVNGYFHRIQHADWFGGKGVGLCRILINGKIVNFYNAHLHAEYDMENDEYKTHRVIQAFDTAQFIEHTRGDSILQILAGDLNTQCRDISYKVLLRTSKMTDSCLKEYIATNECISNSYTAKTVAEKNPLGIRIDHIFFRANDNFNTKTVEYTLPFPKRVPSQKFSYSDHEAVLARIKLSSRQCSQSNLMYEGYCNKDTMEDQTFNTISVLRESIALCETSLEKLKKDRILYLSISIFVAFLLIAIVDYSVPYGFKALYLFLKFVLFGIIIFSLFMGLIWNYMERHGILSGKLSMEIALRYLEKLYYYSN